MLSRNALCRDLSVKTIEEQRQTAEGDFIPTKVTSPGRVWQALLIARSWQRHTSRVRCLGRRASTTAPAPPTHYNCMRMALLNWLKVLNAEVVACTRCPRLVEYREHIAREKRRAYRDHEYWGKPVPGFGDPHARVLVLGLAPGAHGSNRTGRPFTGDASGNFMYPVLHETGFALLPTAISRDDGQVLTGLYITAAARCAPPDNKPLPEELANCAPFLERELEGLKDLRVIVALGRIAFEAYLNYMMQKKTITRKREYEFRHGAEYPMPDGRVLLATYHPSNQNTQTGKLTKDMFQRIFRRARELAEESTVRISP